MTRRLLDEIVFGRWWEISDLHEQIGMATPAERGFLFRMATAYKVNGPPSVRVVAERLVKLSMEKAWATTQPEFAHGLPRDMRTARAKTGGRRMLGHSQDGVEFVISLFRGAAAVAGGNLGQLSMRILRKWNVDDPFEGGFLQATAERLHNGPVQISLGRMPSALEQDIDQAMFLPLPPPTEPAIILFSERFRQLTYTDPSARARILLAITHEIAGHAHDYAVVSGLRLESRKLDRSVMEGWGIFAERRLETLGSEEGALANLYQVKRLLPVIHGPMDGTRWSSVRRQIEAAWPGFFSDPATLVLRRTTGAHARGLVRVLHEVSARGESAARQALPIWV